MGVRTWPQQENEVKQAEAKPAKDGKNAPNDLHDLLEETRILLPGTQVFAGFLITLPFTNRFEKLTTAQQNLYLITLVTVLLALICFIAPAAYHRLARPIHNKQAYKVLANRFVIGGLVPFSFSTVLTTFFIFDVSVSPRIGLIAGLIVAAPILLLWWLFPMLRIHDTVDISRDGD